MHGFRRRKCASVDKENGDHMITQYSSLSLSLLSSRIAAGGKRDEKEGRPKEKKLSLVVEEDEREREKPKV